MFGLLSFTAGVISWKLPETANKPLPEDLSDLDKDADFRDTQVHVLSEDRVKLLEGSIEENALDWAEVEEGMEV